MIRSARIIDGKAISSKLLENLKCNISLIKQTDPSFQPSLAIIQIGSRPDSNLYVSNKIKSAKKIGIAVQAIQLEPKVTQTTIQNEIRRLNDDSKIHGIIVQLPLETDSLVSTDKIVNTVSCLKDVDGLNDVNAGRLANGELSNCFIPCTPKGCFELIKATGVSVSGKNVVVIGRSRLIGTPMSNLLKWNDATVTTCHSKSLGLKEICQKADIIIAAVGKAKLVKQDWIKDNAIVIDCGINELNGKLCGDVDFDEVKNKASFITPVPGGVGPMTVAMLLLNTFESALRFNKINS